MENTPPPSKWVYIFRWILLPLTRWLPGWILRRWFPVERCKEQVVVMAEGVGPHIWINPGRAPAIGLFNLVFVNRLPFPIIVDGLHLEINLESTGLAKFDQISRVTIACGEIAKVSVAEHDLSDSQAEIVRNYPNDRQPCDCPILRIQGYAQLKTPVGEFNKPLDIETRAFVYRG